MAFITGNLSAIIVVMKRRRGNNYILWLTLSLGAGYGPRSLDFQVWVKGGVQVN